MTTRDFDPLEYLTDEAAIAAYLSCPVEDDSDEFQLECLVTAMRARAINQLAETTGIDRTAIYEMFSNAKPNPIIIAKIQASFGTPAKERELEMAQV